MDTGQSIHNLHGTWYVSFYLHLSKYFDSDHLRYNYLASFTSLADFSPESRDLVP